MKHKTWNMKHTFLLLLLLCAGALHAQQLTVNLAPIDGVELTPDNVFGYQVQSNNSKSMNATVKGKLVFRQSNLSFSYAFPATIRPGLNLFEAGSIHPQWTFSSTAFRELFMDYRKLPAGTYEYCVEVSLTGIGGEAIEGGSNRECMYQKSNEVFLINLVDPDNNAKLHEHYPMLSWMVNYPFASALTYKVRVAEVKDGQNNTAAVNRNNPVYQENNIPQTSIVYPAYAKALESWQYYAWTVDAYYKGILLGGAEPWRFVIVEDSILKMIPRDVSHLDIRKEAGAGQAFAIGKLKLKYDLRDFKRDSLQLRLYSNDRELKMQPIAIRAENGDNRYELDLYQLGSLRHLKTYRLEITNEAGEHFKIVFTYVNPDLIN